MLDKHAIAEIARIGTALHFACANGNHITAEKLHEEMRGLLDDTQASIENAAEDERIELNREDDLHERIERSYVRAGVA